MWKDDPDQKTMRLRAVKSAFILEAQSLKARGLAPFARPFYLSAAETELAVAEIFKSQDRQDDAAISLFSAASCLVEAGQFQRAIPLLESVEATFPEAQKMVKHCRGKRDQPLVADTPELRALIRLLLGKGVFTENEWADALGATAPR